MQRLAAWVGYVLLPMRCLHEAVGTALIVTCGSAGVAALLGPTLTAAVWACAVGVSAATSSTTPGITRIRPVS